MPFVRDIKPMPIIVPDDLKIGMFITVLNVKKNIEEEPLMDNPIHELLIPIQRHRIDEVYESLKATVMRIEAINLPYLMVTMFEPFSVNVFKIQRSFSPNIQRKILQTMIEENQNKTYEELKEQTTAPIDSLTIPIDIRKCDFIKINKEYLLVYLGTDRFEKLIGNDNEN